MIMIIIIIIMSIIKFQTLILVPLSSTISCAFLFVYVFPHDAFHLFTTARLALAEDFSPVASGDPSSPHDAIVYFTVPSSLSVYCAWQHCFGSPGL
jgi:hypothetical protein